MSLSAISEAKSPEPLPLAPPISPEATELAWRGVEHCRQGEWTLGLYWLSLAAESAPGGEGLPALFYSYLGYGMARFEGNRRQGLELCRRAVELELYQPEAYYFLAETCLLVGDRRSAAEVLEQGLDIDPEHRDLQALERQMGERQAPILTFLPRQHRLNRWLGRLRYGLAAALVTPG
jgi:tetratricopeptide (TPR) repeat protein